MATDRGAQAMVYGEWRKRAACVNRKSVSKANGRQD